jgi:glutamate racemase
MARILIFDSGVGGLSVLHEIRQVEPGLDVIYVADNGFFPYGNRTEPELIERLPALLTRLCEQHRPDIVVIACNTASTIALEEVRAALDVPVVGTVPAIKPAALRTTTGVIGLLGTPGTVERQYTEELIADYAPNVYVIRHGSSDLVEFAEAKLRGDQLNFTELKSILERLTNHRRGHEMDTLVLACTHFPLLRDEIAHLLSPEITIIDSGEAIARRTLNRLGLNGALKGAEDSQSVASGAGNVVVFTAHEVGLEKLEPSLRALGMDRVEYLED